MTRLEPDRDQIARFVDALFRYADHATYAAIRFYPDDKSGGVWQPDLWRAPRLGSSIVDAVVELARLCANAPVPVVFCPPLVTFKTPHNAQDENVADGLALSVDCDTNPAAARATLEELLGPATVAVASGGEWVNPDTGEVAPKLHSHWRLAVPVQTAEGHQALKLARHRATRLISGDATGVPLCHPYRWPGSWHRKNYDRPRLARIVHINETEIDLAAALARLPEADDEHGFSDLVGAPVEFCTELSDYGEAALRSAAKNILTAPNGRQERTLNAEAYGIGRCVASGGAPRELALDVLIAAAKAITNYDTALPWRDGQAERKVRRAFAQGVGLPRPTLAEREAEYDRTLAAQGDAGSGDFDAV